MTTLAPLPDGFATTRDSLHAIAEHVMAAIQYEELSLIGLRPTPHGFGTQMLPHERLVRIVDGRIVDDGPSGERADDIVTIADAAAFVGVAPGAPHGVYEPATDGDPHRPLEVDRAAATVLGDWFTFGAIVLTQVRNAADEDDKPSVMQLWPEHFDLAIDLGPQGVRVNVGASPGDADHPEPYLYVGPWETVPEGEVWNERFGASRSYADLLQAADPVADAVAWIAHTRSALGR